MHLTDFFVLPGINLYCKFRFLPIIGSLIYFKPYHLLFNCNFCNFFFLFCDILTAYYYYPFLYYILCITLFRSALSAHFVLSIIMIRNIISTISSLYYLLIYFFYIPCTRLTVLPIL